jgi:hypothetical protein
VIYLELLVYIKLNGSSDHPMTLEGETLANDYHWRSTKAKKQLRDRLGRWISQGANVRFRSDGQEQSGIVTSVINGKAYVDQKNRDGSTTQKILDPSAIRVLASKATLPPDGTKIIDDKNNFAEALKSDDYAKAIQENGKALIERADGYALSAAYQDKAEGTDNKLLDGSEPHEDNAGGNPILYQLYAPGGRSLGLYSEGAEGDFDGMVAEDQAETAPGAGQGEAPAAGGDGGAIAASVLSADEEEKPFRVPDAVKQEILSTLGELSTSIPEADLAVANRLANDSTVSLSDVKWIHGFFSDNDASERLRGGYKGRKWADKIVASGDSTLDEHPKYCFDDDKFAYFAVGSDAGSTFVNKLLSVDYESGQVYSWTPEGFVVIPDLDIADVEEPQIIPIDEMTADEFAHWLDASSGEEFDILDTDPEERNIFTLAESEIDFEELDRVFSIIAAGTDGDGFYSPVERSQNAKVQRRGAGGRFGQQPDEKAAAPEASKEAPVKKATLPMELPVVPDPAARIQEWLSTAAEAPVVAAGEPEYTEEDQAVEDAATGPTDEALYFAIVDEVDKTAVLDAIAIVKQGGQPVTFKRSGGAWVADPNTLTLLQGATPPTVVELPDPETVKTVLEQIDAHDAGQDTTPEPDAAMAPQPGEVPVAASGFARPDGSYTIIDVEDLEAVVASAGEVDIFIKSHIRKRARALNRMDLVPAEWREFSLAEIGELNAAQTVYGEFGEIIVAAGIPGVADTPSDFKNVAKLQAYWTTGKGALKIRWGTPGDLTRAHRHLSKYVGPQRAWGLAQKYHRSLFGVYNQTHDVATGQYAPRKRKK